MAWDTEHSAHSDSGSKSRDGSVVVRRGRSWRALPDRADFLRVRAAGLRRSMPGFVLQAAPAHPSDSSKTALPVRIGFTASKKVGNAVARNRAKRRLRALADKVMGDGDESRFDYVLIARTETLTRNFGVMESELRTALRKLHDGRRHDTGRSGKMVKSR